MVARTSRKYQHVALLIERFAIREGSVLEIGCGGKQYSENAGGRHWGIDLTSGIYPGDTPDLIADAHDIPLVDGSVRLVYVVAALHLMDNPLTVMKEAHRVLEPGGRLLIFDYNWWVCRRLKAPHLMSSRSLRGKLIQAGFGPRIHWDCVPIQGPGFMRSLWSFRSWRFLVYLISNWVIVSGEKPGNLLQSMPSNDDAVRAH